MADKTGIAAGKTGAVNDQMCGWLVGCGVGILVIVYEFWSPKDFALLTN